MVKLTVAPRSELYAKEKKLPPGIAVEIPLEKEADVYVAQRPFWTKGTVCSLLTFLTILAVGGALLALLLRNAHRAPRCYDWGPDCEMKGPPVPPAEYYHDGPGMEPAQSGGNSHEMHGSHSRHQGPHHGGDGGHHPEGHSSSSSSSEERGSGHDRPHEHAEVHPEDRPNPPPEAPIQDDY